MTQQTPCQAGNAEDWFIERDGLQYHDQPFRVDVDEVLRRWDADGDKGVDDVALEIRAEMKKAALIRRRQAKQACYSCPARLPCLTVALETEAKTGTWGGYYPEELRRLYREIEERKNR